VEKDRRVIIDRANRMLRQSKTLRQMSDELLKESKDIRVSASPAGRSKRRKRR
jgi:hypothetical protein